MQWLIKTGISGIRFKYMLSTDTSRSATAGGFVALAIWSSTVAVARTVAESLGPLTGAGMAMLAGGLLLMGFLWCQGVSPASMLKLPRKYLLICGGLFVAYELCVFAAIGWSPNRSVTLAAGLMNYTWPALTVALSIPILGRRARWPIIAGLALALAGAVGAMMGTGEIELAQLARAGLSIAIPLALAGMGAVLWAVYSNLVKLLADPKAGAVPLFLIVAGILALVIGQVRGENQIFSARAIGELAFLAIFQSAAAYSLWERGMRRGNHLLLSLVSYFLPIASMAIAAIYLQVLPGWQLWAGCAMVTAGALICRYSLSEKADVAAK